MSKNAVHPTDLCEINQIISHSWDANVQIRAADLEQETDYSYTHVIKPWVLDQVLRHTTEDSSILDIGCGCGYLTHAVYQCSRHKIEGIDLSSASIAYAQNKYPAISFSCQDICTISARQQYDLCLAVMTLNNMPFIKVFFSSVKKLLQPHGRIIIVIPHPCYWPSKHLADKEYSYLQEKAYEFTFSTKGRADYASHILYFHRPLETYLRNIQEAGFQLTEFRELREMPDEPIPDIVGIEIQNECKGKSVPIIIGRKKLDVP